LEKPLLPTIEVSKITHINLYRSYHSSVNKWYIPYDKENHLTRDHILALSYYNSNFMFQCPNCLQYKRLSFTLCEVTNKIKIFTYELNVNKKDEITGSIIKNVLCICLKERYYRVVFEMVNTVEIDSIDNILNEHYRLGKNP
jgi:hypothetical protein